MSEVKVPEMGESITEGTISKWLVKVGEPVKAGDVLVELETDKVNIEISAEVGGVLQNVTRQEGDTVQIGETIATIGEASAVAPAGQGAAEGGKDSPAAAVPDPEPKAEPSGGGEAAQQQHVSSAAAEPQAAAGGRDEAADAAAARSASPAARKLARERGIDLSRVPAADPIGRVTSGDVRAFGANGSAAAQSAAPAAPQQAAQIPAAADEPGKPAERKRMSRRRLTIASRLVEAQRTAAMLTTFNEVDMTAILDLRKRRKQSFQEKHDVNLGFMSFFTKAVVGALKAFPLLNAEIQGEDVLVKKYYDIGIAVSAKEGLVVPVVREADRLSFAEIEKQIVELAGKARSNTLALSELKGGTFTITNGGVFGSLLSTPILNAPQVGILGMHKIQLRPVAIDEERMENRPMMYLALSYDHRIVDGAEAVRFLVVVKELLEDPESLLLEG